MSRILPSLPPHTSPPQRSANSSGAIDVLLSALHYVTVAASQARNGECSGPLATAQKAVQDSVEFLKNNEERHALSKIATAHQTVKVGRGKGEGGRGRVREGEGG